MNLMYEILLNSITITENVIFNNLFIYMLTVFAFFCAWNLVKKSGIRGNLGSIIHWSIRIIIIICFIFFVQFF